MACGRRVDCREVFELGGVALLESLLLRPEPEIKSAALFALAALSAERTVADQLSLDPFVQLLKTADPRTKAAALAIVDNITQNSDLKKAQLLNTSTLPEMIQMMSAPVRHGRGWQRSRARRCRLSVMGSSPVSDPFRATAARVRPC